MISKGKKLMNKKWTSVPLHQIFSSLDACFFFQLVVIIIFHTNYMWPLRKKVSQGYLSFLSLHIRPIRWLFSTYFFVTVYTIARRNIIIFHVNNFVDYPRRNSVSNPKYDFSFLIFFCQKIKNMLII